MPLPNPAVDAAPPETYIRPMRLLLLIAVLALALSGCAADLLGLILRAEAPAQHQLATIEH